MPLAARAQQVEGVRRIGVLMNTSAKDTNAVANLADFTQALQQLGWTAGKNIRIETGGPKAAPAKFANTQRNWSRLHLMLFFQRALRACRPLLQATHTVPIVFVNVADPVGAGFVESMARPGGNVTGFVQFEYSLSAKWLELLKQIAPNVTRVAVLRDPAITSGIGQFAVIQSVAPGLGVDVTAINVRDAAEIERAVAAFARSSNGGLILTLARWRRSIAS